jgi:multimeric flavodoxin WrbA
MKIATVLGSPRKKGNTSKVLAWVEESLEAHDHRVDRIRLVDHKINGCKGEWTCKKFLDEPGCPEKDDAVAILGRLMDSDLVLYATPVYFWGPTAQMKAFIDRHCSLVTGYGTANWRSLMQGKRIGVVATCQEAVENNADLLLETFTRLSVYLKCTDMGALVIPHANAPEALGDPARAQAIAFADQISGQQ